MTGKGLIKPQAACGVEATVTVTVAFTAPYKICIYIVVR